MPDPDGELTASQFEILELLWNSDRGLTVVEIWESTCGQRGISRTTTLNVVDRLEKRGWLKRDKIDGLYRYTPAVTREKTEARMASTFVGDFFGGSPSQFVLSLLGSKNISKTELDRLRSLLDSHASQSESKKRKG